MKLRSILNQSIVLISLFIHSFHIHLSHGFSLLRKRRAPIPLSEEIGTSPTLSYEYFDPLNFATEDNFAILREAELKHGRIAMLAVLGNFVPDIWRETIVPPSSILLSPSHLLSFQEVPCGIKALTTVPIVGWIQIVAFIGFLERKVFVQKNPRDMPGDYGTGYFGTRNKGENERSLRSELENGRLAMIAFLGQIVAEIFTGHSVWYQIQNTLALSQST
jgi:light-harvesting complex I chlorophyll a/b binding protein 1